MRARCCFCILIGSVAFSFVLSACHPDLGQMQGMLMRACFVFYHLCDVISTCFRPVMPQKHKCRGRRGQCTPEHWLWYAYSTVTTVYRQTVGVMDTICRQDKARL